jgi:copper chaperone
MGKTDIRVENIKCGGCAASITRRLKGIPGVIGVRVEVAEGCVTLESEIPVREEAVRALAKLGYSAPGANKLSAKAKSFVSCAIGRVSGG